MTDITGWELITEDKSTTLYMPQSLKEPPPPYRITVSKSKWIPPPPPYPKGKGGK